MNKDNVAKLTDIAASFSPASQVKYIFDVGPEEAGHTQKLHEAYPLAEMHYFEPANAIRLDAFMDAHRIGGIDIFWLDIAGSALEILKGSGKKLRTVRLIHIEQPILKDVRKFLLRNGFRYFDGGVFVNKDIAPRWLGIVKKRMMMKLRKF